MVVEANTPHKTRQKQKSFILLCAKYTVDHNTITDLNLWQCQQRADALLLAKHTVPRDNGSLTQHALNYIHSSTWKYVDSYGH